MAIDHADWLFNPLCKMHNSITFEEYEKLLIEESKNKIGKNSKSTEMHLYTLTTLKLVKTQNIGKRKYSMSDLGEQICEVHGDPSNIKPYRKRLLSIIKRNRKVGPVFNNFLQVIKNRSLENDPIHVNEISKMFLGGTSRTLYMFGIETDSIIDNNGLLGIRSEINEKEITLDEFKKKMINIFRTIQNKRKKGIEPKIIYIDIARIRDIFLTKYGITENEKFDNLLKRLIESDIGKDIHVYGTAPQWFTQHSKEDNEELIFKHKGKIYVYISIS